MKEVVAALTAVSVVFNLALIVVLFAGRGSAPEKILPPAAAITPPTPTGPTFGNDTWSNLQTSDLPAMIQRLRDQGFPPEFVRAIVAAQLREAYAARIKALDPDADSRPYWKNTTIDPRVQQAQSQLYREQAKKLRELLGADGDPNEQMMALYQGRRLDSVPAEKVDEVRRLLREHDDARNEVFSNSVGLSMSTDFRKKLTALDQRLQESLTNLLTPAELEAYNLRNSDTARQLRSNLSAFNPTEDEFRAIYKIQAEFDARQGPYLGMLGPEESRKRSEAQRAVQEQTKATLGPVRGEEYARTNDHSYRQTSQLVARLELPPETTARIWEMKESVEERANSLRRDTSLTPDQRNQQLAALAEQSTNQLSQWLGGARGVEAFKQHGGFWLQNLTPRPTRPSPAREAVRTGP